MSDPFAAVQNNLGNIVAGQTGQFAAAQKDLGELQKKFKKGKGIEEGIGGAKVFMSGKKIVAAAKNNLGKYAKQELKKGFEQFKDQWKKEIQSKVEGYKPSADPRALDPWSNDATNVADAADDTDAIAANKAAEVSKILAKGQRRLEEGEDVYREGYEGIPEDAEDNLLNGTGKLLRSSEIEKTIQTTASADPEAAAEAVAQETTLAGKMSVAGDFTHPERENVADNEGLAKALPEDNLEENEFGTEASKGLTQQEIARVQELTPKVEPPPVSTNAENAVRPGGPAAEEAEDGLKIGEKSAQEAADKALAEKLAEKTAAKGAEEVTSEEAVGGFLDDTGILAPIGLIVGAVGGITAYEDAKKKMPKLSLPQVQSGASFQVGIN